ncbi:MAG: NAD(P)/FAD-dependent oxidoreductase [Oceanihabitans sp.]
MELAPFLSTKIINNNNPAIKASFGFGKVLQTGRIDTPLLISAYRKHLASTNNLQKEAFNYNALELHENYFIYQNMQAKHIVFAEGFGLKKNPFFSNLPLNGTKGELLTIHAPNLNIDFILKSSVFIIPLGQDLYRIGATYEWKDKTNTTTIKAKEELLQKLKSFLNCDFKVIDQVAGIRPTVKDRRPLVGQHAANKNMYVLNGLGTRGVLIAPYVAKQLFQFIENQIPLESDINISRFISS